MQARIRKNGDITVVELTGKLDFGTAQPFRETCEQILKTHKVVFNMAGLDFVGSCGIGAFVSTLREVSANATITPRFCHMRSEFQRVFKSADSELFKIFENENAALESFIEAVVGPQLSAHSPPSDIN